MKNDDAIQLQERLWCGLLNSKCKRMLMSKKFSNCVTIFWIERQLPEANRVLAKCVMPRGRCNHRTLWWHRAGHVSICSRYTLHSPPQFDVDWRNKRNARSLAVSFVRRLSQVVGPPPLSLQPLRNIRRPLHDLFHFTGAAIIVHFNAPSYVHTYYPPWPRLSS